MKTDDISSFYCMVQGLAIGYGKTALLHDITLAIRRGEILTLIGPNGAGKSTLLKTLAGQLAAQGGSILLDGARLETLSPNRRAKKLALMLPHTHPTEYTTCFDLAAAGRTPYTGRLGILSAEDRRQVHRALALVGAEDLATRDFNTISDGQRQRVLLARAICQQPELLLLDEPTSFLDLNGKLELLSILKRLAREQNVAVVLSLHELDLAQKISDRVVCVAPEGISAVGTPEEVFSTESIRVLYKVQSGEYNALYGSVELEKPHGTPQTFVIGGAGRGIPVYRRLQRAGVPFYAGILYENDLDFPVADALAAETVTQAAFTPIREETFVHAKALLDRCSRVLCVPQSAGPYNAANRRLAAYAAAAGKKVDANVV